MGRLSDAPIDIGRHVTESGYQYPRTPRSQRVLLWLLGVPGGNLGGFTERRIKRYLDLPDSTRFSAGFRSRNNNLYVGENCALGDTVFLDFAPVIIGNRTRFSLRNIVITSMHDYNDFEVVITEPVVIGSDVWITAGVIILPGVKIGDGSVIGAGSVVTSDIPEGVLAAGNPCRVVREIQRS